MKKKRRLHDRHHIFFPRSTWKEGWAKELRSHWYCIPLIPRDTVHHRIHAMVPEIPLIDGTVCKEVLAKLNHLDNIGALHGTDDLASRLRLLICLLNDQSSPTVVALKKQLRIIKPRR